MTGTAHLVGGLAFETGEQAMRSVAANAAGVVDWVPDGETGVRRKWMSQHRTRFDAQEALELKPVSSAAGLRPEIRGTRHGAGKVAYGLKAGRSVSDLNFASFGYAEAALESYRLFSQLKAQGIVHPTARFMVAMPTPFGTATAFVHPDERGVLLPAIERGMFNDVRAIADAVPHGELAIQWDVAHEFGILTGFHETNLADPLGTVVQNVIRAVDSVPSDIPVGCHLCYGGAFGVHFVEPEDTAHMAQVIRGVLAGAKRRVDRFHLPVPMNREDAAYFAPLRGIDFGPTRLYLGLVHHEDGLDGARRRIAAAKQVVPEFGVGTECGTGRVLADPDALLRLHAEIAQAAAAPADRSIEVPANPRPHPAPDPVEINNEFRRVAEQVKCEECGAQIGKPCGDDPSSRPHMDRYHEAMLGVLAGRLAPVSQLAQ